MRTGVKKMGSEKREELEGLVGERVTFWCLNYIYSGTLMRVYPLRVLLHDAVVVYETGELTADTWKDAQPLPGPWYVQLGAVESFGVMK